MLAKRPNLTVAQVARALRRGADKVPGQTASNHEYGCGRSNIYRALRAI